jgi:hypothetical protein
LPETSRHGLAFFTQQQETIMHKAVLTAVALSVSALPASSQEIPKIICAGHVSHSDRADRSISVGGHRVDIASAPGANPLKLQFAPGLQNTPVILITPAVPGHPFIEDVSPGSVLIGDPPAFFHFICVEK